MGVGRVSNGGWLLGNINKLSEDTLYNVCRGLWLVEDNDCGNAAEGITSATSFAGILGYTHRALLTLVLLYHHLAHDSNVAVLLLAPRYPAKQLM